MDFSMLLGVILCIVIVSHFGIEELPYGELVKSNSSIEWVSLFFSIIPESSLFMISLICFLYFLFGTRPSESGPMQSAFLTIYLLIIMLISVAVFSFFDMSSLINTGEYDSWYAMRNQTASVIELCIIFIVLCIFSISSSYSKLKALFTYESCFIILITMSSFCMLLHANNLVFMYLCLELSTSGCYLLIAYAKDYRCMTTAIRYYIISCLSATMMLFGFSLTYAYSGSIWFDDIYQNLNLLLVLENKESQNAYLCWLGVLFAFLGFIVKLYAAPIHMWIPDLYDGSDVPFTFFLSTIPTLSFAYIFTRFYHVLHPMVVNYSIYLFVFSIITMFSGMIGALVQFKIRRLVAYSSISAMGFVLSGLSCNDFSILSKTFLYLLLYVFNLFPIFIFLLICLYNHKEILDEVSYYNGFFHRNAFFSISYLLSIFSLAGLPPFSIFYGKIYLTTSFAFNYYYIILFFILATSFAGYYAYLRLMKSVIYDSESEHLHTKYLSYLSVIYYGMILFFISLIFNIIFFYFSFSLEAAVYNVISTFFN